MKTLWLSIFSLFVMVGCQTSFQGEYADPESVEIVDSRFNETDQRTMARVLIASMISKPWLDEFKLQTKKRPIVMVGGMENRTDEHIDLKAMTETVRYELINSGKVRFVNAQGRQKIIDELAYQRESGMVAGSSQKQLGKQLGADFLLTGALSSHVHAHGGKKTITYKVTMQLTNLETAEYVWVQEHEVKKRFRQASYGM